MVGKDSGAEFEDSAFTPLRGYLVEKYHFDDGMSEPSEAVNVIRKELSMLQDLVCINMIITQPSIYRVIVYFLLCHESMNY